LADVLEQLKDLKSEDKKFPVILCDAPWTFKTYSKKGDAKSPSKHYSTMSIEDLKALPVRDVAADGSILFMWCYQPLLKECIEVMEAWGFRYVSIGFVWRKLTKHGKEHMSTGYYTRAGMEMVLIGRRGNPPRPKNKGVRQVFSSTVREHSRKPDEVYDFIEKMYDGPYLELFARNSYRKDWTKVGNEVGKLV
jgi:N6-adenosine-specific RNA methylase IME4